MTKHGWATVVAELRAEGVSVSLLEGGSADPIAATTRLHPGLPIETIRWIQFVRQWGRRRYLRLPASLDDVDPHTAIRVWMDLREDRPPDPSIPESTRGAIVVFLALSGLATRMNGQWTAPGERVDPERVEGLLAQARTRIRRVRVREGAR